MLKRITASGGGTLTPDADESFRVSDVFCAPSANDTYLTLYVENHTVNKLRVKGKTGNHCPYPNKKLSYEYEFVLATLFSVLRAFGIDLSIPVPSGSVFTVARYAETGDVCVKYDVYDKDDVKPDDPNGMLAKVHRYVHYGENLAAITATPAVVDTSLIWTGGSKWPFDGSGVPAKTVMRILAILASPSARGDATNNKGYTTYLQMIRDNTVLFDPDRNGLPLLGLSTQTANAALYQAVASVLGMATAEYPHPALVLPEALEFVEGEKLTTNVLTAAAAASGIAASEFDMAYVIEREAL
jgi:hypothetical protein